MTAKRKNWVYLGLVLLLTGLPILFQNCGRGFVPGVQSKGSGLGATTTSTTTSRTTTSQPTGSTSTTVSQTTTTQTTSRGSSTTTSHTTTTLPRSTTTTMTSRTTTTTSVIAKSLHRKFGVILESLKYHQVALEKAANAHLGMMRIHAYWRFIETQKGTFNFTNLDKYVADANALGVDVYMTLGLFPPQWANGTSGQTCNIFADGCASLPPLDPADYRNFVTKVVQRYAGKVKYYGVWNEPDLRPFWNGPFDQYIREILVNGANAVRAADPGAKVVGPEIFDSTAKLGAALSSACSRLDIISIHLFRDSTSKNLWHLRNDQIPAIKSACPGKPIWVSAFGARSDELGEDGQAATLTEMFEGLNAQPEVKGIVFYTLIDLENGLKQGVIEGPAQNYREKPAYISIQNFLKALLGLP